MASQSHHQTTKSSVKPFRPKSLTLLNETGNVEIYRVSEETKKKVEEDSRRINSSDGPERSDHVTDRILSRKSCPYIRLFGLAVMRTFWVYSIRAQVDQNYEFNAAISIFDRKLCQFSSDPPGLPN